MKLTSVNYLHWAHYLRDVPPKSAKHVAKSFKLLGSLLFLSVVLTHNISAKEIALNPPTGDWISQPHTFDEWYKQAIIDGKEKRFNESLSVLGALHLAEPQNVRVLADYITVLSWANFPQFALKFGEKLDPTTAPIYVLNTLARTARDTAQYPLAIRYYEALISRQPNEIDPKVGKIMTLVDAKQFTEAEDSIRALRVVAPSNVALLKAMSYLGQRSNQPVITADANMQLLKLNANYAEAAKHLISASSELGAENEATALTQQYPQSIDEKGLVALKNNSAAFHINWDKYSFSDINKRFEDADIALKTLDSACQCDWAKLDLNVAENRRLMFDHILALRDRFRMVEVTAIAESILQSNRARTTSIDLPAHILNAFGDAYLYQKKPKTALYYYECSLKKAPSNFETKMSKFYALVEAEYFQQATSYIDSVNTAEAPYRTSTNGKISRENSDKFRAELASYMVRAYGDNLAYAEVKVAKLSETGPLNNDLKSATALIHRWRGWPEKSQAEFNRLLTDYPQNISSQVGVADTMLDLNEWREAEATIKTAYANYPEDLNVQRVNRRWMLHNERELQFDFITGESNGNQLGSRSTAANARIYTAPIGYDYRVFAQTHYDYGSFIEGNASALWPGIGAEYKARDWRITAELNTTSLGNNGVSPEVTIDYRANDYWSFGARAGINTADVPLRGLRIGTSANVLQLSMAYRLSDLTQFAASAALTDLSDGNKRETLGLALTQRLITTPHYKADLGLRIDTSRNDVVIAPYFNPEQDFEVSALLDQRWTQWRDYDKSFTHRLQLGIGSYNQKNFGNDASWIASYAHEWRFENRFELDYGVSFKRHAYDGVLENNKQLFGRINWLF